jgi:hypothetical protein
MTPTTTHRVAPFGRRKSRCSSHIQRQACCCQSTWPCFEHVLKGSCVSPGIVLECHKLRQGHCKCRSVCLLIVFLCLNVTFVLRCEKDSICGVQNILSSYLVISVLPQLHSSGTSTADISSTLINDTAQQDGSYNVVSLFHRPLRW